LQNIELEHLVEEMGAWASVRKEEFQANSPGFHSTSPAQWDYQPQRRSDSGLSSIPDSKAAN